MPGKGALSCRLRNNRLNEMAEGKDSTDPTGEEGTDSESEGQ